MNFVETLLAYLTNHVAAAAAIGGLTIAGGAVAVSQVATDPEPVEEVEEVEDDGTDDEDANGTEEADGTEQDNGTEEADGTEQDTAATALEEEDDDLSDDADDADDNGRSQAVHDVIFGGEVEPGDPEFGRRVAAAASQGRSEQRGNSDNARPAPDNGDETTDEPAAERADNGDAGRAQGEQNREAGQAKAQENQAKAQEKREAAQDRRPAPGDEADEDTQGDSAQGAPAARGRG